MLVALVKQKRALSWSQKRSFEDNIEYPTNVARVCQHSGSFEMCWFEPAALKIVECSGGTSFSVANHETRRSYITI